MPILIRVGLVVKRYRILSVIGEGSSGKVFIASSPYNQEVILKFIPLKNDWCRKEFDREVSSLTACLDCPLIVNIETSFIYKGYGVIVLEKLKGDLLDYLQLYQPLEINFVKNIFFQICVAVLYIHKRCIAHLDIKPENIFMANNSTVKLGDFGSSYHWQDDFEFKLGAVGTSYYCAPEVGPSQPYDPCKADVWSLGILLHVLLTGFWPFKGKNESFLNENVKYGRIHLFVDSMPDDDSLHDLLYSMLTVNPRDRISISEILTSKWMTELPQSSKEKRNRFSSTPNIYGNDSIHRDAIETLDNIQNDDDGDDISFEKLNLRDDIHVPSSTGGVFNFSDGDNSAEEDYDDVEPWGDDIVQPKRRFSKLQQEEDILGTSLPDNLTAEPMKVPRSCVNVPSEASPESTLAAPIKPTSKKSRKSSFVNFINSKVRGRRSSAVDSIRKLHLSPSPSPS